MLTSRETRETAVVAKEIEFEMTAQQKAECPVSAERPELYFTPDLKGYGWVFRKGDYLNIGLGREDKQRLSGHVERFRDYLEQGGRIPRNLPGKFKGHAYLLYPHARRQLVDERMLLIGDAAGLAYAQSGEGIRPAVESALLAARVITNCQGNYGLDRLQPFVQELEHRFGRRQLKSIPAHKTIPHFRQALARILMRSRWFSRNMLIKRWFLHANEAPLPSTFIHVRE
jgi:flavin-dependent dehydrogenase